MNPSLIWLNSNVDSNMEKDLWAVEFSSAYCKLQKMYHWNIIVSICLQTLMWNIWWKIFSWHKQLYWVTEVTKRIKIIKQFPNSNLYSNYKKFLKDSNWCLYCYVNVVDVVIILLLIWLCCCKDRLTGHTWGRHG